MRIPETKALRCAIYTRVSTDAGLEQEFNSLDNQREAAEAYIKSQAHEGWRCLPTLYDDGGFSGGSMDRPALRRLLDDIRGRQIDVVVVYKVDRLTRSLSDFAKLVELFDQHAVSFVSVTQAFNTTTSMGRLTLNVLLSFAQFEREVTAERIRDKIAASKRRGMRMGGPVPLGYDVEKKKLVINPEEAERVRFIFQRYLQLGCLTKLARDLEARSVMTKVTRRGQGVRGGIPFTTGPLHYLLRNRVYVGEITHKGQHFPGEHELIVDRELFDAVQQRLASGARVRGRNRINGSSLLVGRIYDDRGNRMTPSSADKNGARYRYYISAPLAQGRAEDAGSLARVSAPEVEAVVLKALRQRERDTAAATPDSTDAPHSDREFVEQFVTKVTIRQGAIEITLSSDAEEPIRIEWSPTNTRPRRIILSADTPNSLGRRPIRAEARARLVEGLAKARIWLDELVTGKVQSTSEIAERERCSERSVRMTLSLAFTSPRIAKAAVDGTLPFGSGTSRLADLPTCWREQSSHY